MKYDELVVKEKTGISFQDTSYFDDRDMVDLAILYSKTVLRHPAKLLDAKWLQRTRDEYAKNIETIKKEHGDGLRLAARTDSVYNPQATIDDIIKQHTLMRNAKHLLSNRVKEKTKNAFLDRLLNRPENTGQREI